MTKPDSLTSYLIEHASEEKASFHMPGHKGSAFFRRVGYGDVFGCPSGAGDPSASDKIVGAASDKAVCAASDKIAYAADFDITEIPGADDLRKKKGIIKDITDKYSKLYGSRRSYISVNGSSAPIMAAIMATIEPGHKIIAAADSHISVRNGIRLAGAEAVYVKPIMLSIMDREEPDNEVSDNEAPGKEALSAPCQVFESDGEGLPGGLDPEDVKKALTENPDADAVILPSPNYFGVVSDIEKIAEITHSFGKVLIVDQAHGAHLKMFSRAGIAGSIPKPAEECGADIVIDSTHKTMASFTQSAVAHVFGDRVDPDRYEEALLTLESTSPSYILMDSLAVNADIMEEQGEELALSWMSDLEFFYEEVKKIHGIAVLTGDMVRNASGGLSDHDDSKIVIDTGAIGLTGEETQKKLIERGIFPEFTTGNIVMCLTGIGNVRADYELLISALREISGDKSSDKKIPDKKSSEV